MDVYFFHVWERLKGLFEEFGYAVLGGGGGAVGGYPVDFQF